MHRDPETTNQRAGGKGDKADTMQHRHGNTYTSSCAILLLFTMNFSLLLVSVSISFLLFGLHPLVLTAAGE